MPALLLRAIPVVAELLVIHLYSLHLEGSTGNYVHVIGIEDSNIISVLIAKLAFVQKRLLTFPLKQLREYLSGRVISHAVTGGHRSGEGPIYIVPDNRLFFTGTEWFGFNKFV